MFAKGFFNIVLVLSFLLSNLGGTATTQVNQTGPVFRWNTLDLLGSIESWLQGLKIIRFEGGEAVHARADVAETTTPGPRLGVTPTDEPSLTPTPTFFPAATEIITPTSTPTTPPSEDISPSATPTLEPTGEFTQTTSLILTAQPEKVMPGYPLIITWELQGWDPGEGNNWRHDHRIYRELL